MNCPSAIASASYTCIARVDSFDLSECYQERLIAAAEASAHAAQCGNVLAFLALGLTMLTLIGLALTLFYNGKALKVASSANELAREHGEAQVRAYLIIQDAACRLTDNGQVTIQPRFSNSGQSPARQVRWLARAIIQWRDSDHHVRSAFSDKTMNLEQSVWRNEIAAHSSLQMTALAVNLLDIPNRFPETAEPCPTTIEIFVDYEDVFGNHHVTKACFLGLLKIRERANLHTNLLERASDDAYEKFMSVPDQSQP